MPSDGEKTRKPLAPVSGDYTYRDGILYINRKLGKKTVRTRYRVVDLDPDPAIGSPAISLEKENGTKYDIILTEHGWRCDCGDAEFRRANSPLYCKHVVTAIAAGLIPKDGYNKNAEKS